MSKNSNGDGLVYLGDTGRHSVYDVYLRHRVVATVTVDVQLLSINVARPGGQPGGKDLRSHARMRICSHPVEPNAEHPDGVEVVEHIDTLHLYLVIWHKLPYLLADLYVPREVTV